ncbi:ANK REP REGION domain-containing protein [Citrus sinensis]|uniref:ANK REP REGION domain-containing protein n=1 Tax=Citrus sinensis TaxID=2711 RepID=A0ACB8JLK6_CITSI|nr:ANK REP REGION domain-containing protein [Citrus sinensis]
MSEPNASSEFDLNVWLANLPQELPPGSQETPGNDQVLVEAKDTDYIHNLTLYRAVDSGDLETTKSFLDLHPDALTASLSSDGDTALHIAVLAGRVKVVEELVKRIDKKDLAIKNKNGATALNFAATGGVTKIAEYLVRKSRELLTIPNQHGNIPVVIASLYGHDDMVRYLYRETPIAELDPDKGTNGAMLLTSCIIDDIFDIPLDLLQRYRKLAYAQDNDGDTAIDMLAQKPSAFPSGTQLAFWKKWIYSSMTKLLHMVWKSLNLFVPAIKHIYEVKLAHVQTQELLSCVCREISTQGESQFEKVGIKKVVFIAVKHGIVEFITEIMKHYPDIIWCYDDYNRHIFLYATLQRQEKIFNLIYTMGAKKNSVATNWDKAHNNILHQAAFLAPSSQLDRVSGAALQMQRELQWFKEVESIVQPKYKEMVNLHNKTPQALFSDQHKKLVEQGEKWMKETAESCTVVAALIATIMFSAAFTVPGGYDEYTGIPLYLHRNSFMVFIVSDAMSLFSSCTSVLMFLGILTSRYGEEDFLKSLPRQLIIGLSSLFFSIATMMVTFGVTLVIILKARIAWVSFPIILLAGLPVTLFALLQFPLLVEIFYSTYGPGIFNKPKKWWIIETE